MRNIPHKANDCRSATPVDSALHTLAFAVHSYLCIIEIQSNYVLMSTNVKLDQQESHA